MKLKVLIIDDEPAFFRSLEKVVASKSDQVELLGWANSVADGLKKINELKPELIFLDIQMPDGTGFDLLNRCDIRDFKIIFVTAYDQYALEAFKFSAVDYLLKPIVTTELWDAIERAQEDVQKSKFGLQLDALKENMTQLSQGHKKIVLKDHDTLHMVRLENILWCTADGSYTLFHMVGGSQVVVSKNLQEYEQLLSNNGFFRVHRSYLVNVSKIEKFDKSDGGTIHLEEGQQLPVSSRKKEQLSQHLTNLI